MKDLGQHYGDLRKQLVTVPSCALHNGEQSRDDEYTALIVMVSITNEDIGADHFLSKFRRTMERSPRFRSMLEASLTPTVSDGHQTASLRIDQGRYGGVMARISRGLHFHEVGTRLNGRLHIDTPCLGTGSPEVGFRDASRSHPADLQVKWVGDPRIFEYALAVEPFYLHMKFYGGFDVFVTPATTAERDDL